MVFPSFTSRTKQPDAQILEATPPRHLFYPPSNFGPHSIAATEVRCWMDVWMETVLTTFSRWRFFGVQVSVISKHMYINMDLRGSPFQRATVMARPFWCVRFWSLVQESIRTQFWRRESSSSNMVLWTCDCFNGRVKVTMILRSVRVVVFTVFALVTPCKTSPLH